MVTVSNELVGVAEIADLLDVPRTTVSMWDSRRDRSGFPHPVARLRAGPVYDLADVRAWWEGRQTPEVIE